VARTLAVFLLARPSLRLWFGKNWALTGNPTYPLLYAAFDGKTGTRKRNASGTACIGHTISR